MTLPFTTLQACASNHDQRHVHACSHTPCAQIRTHIGHEYMLSFLCVMLQHIRMHVMCTANRSVSAGLAGSQRQHHTFRGRPCSCRAVGWNFGCLGQQCLCQGMPHAIAMYMVAMRFTFDKIWIRLCILYVACNCLGSCHDLHLATAFGYSHGGLLMS